MNTHWIGLTGHQNALCIFMFLMLLISWQRYSSMDQIRVIIYLFPVNYIDFLKIWINHSLLLNNHFSCKFWCQQKFDCIKKLPANFQLKSLKSLMIGSLERVRGYVTHIKRTTIFFFLAANICHVIFKVKLSTFTKMAIPAGFDL